MSDTAVGTYEIRWAEDKDWIPAMHMIWKTFLKFEAVDYTEEGIRNFYDFITDEHLYKSFLQGRYQMMVALDGSTTGDPGASGPANPVDLMKAMMSGEDMEMFQNYMELFDEELSASGTPAKKGDSSHE